MLRHEMLLCTPQILTTNLTRREGAYVQTSLSRAFPHDGQTGLSLVARSTFPRKKLSAFSFQLSVGAV